MAITALPINASGGSPSYSARQTRQAFAALMMPGVGPLRTQSGFRLGGAPTVSVTASTWTVGPLTALVDAAVSTIQAPYLIASDANATGSVTAANATNPRKDILYLQVSDTDEDASGARAATISYLAGTAAASPTAPATPARSLLIGVIDVPKVGAGSPAFTASNAWTAAAGGIVPVAAQAARDALTPYAGLGVYRLDTKQVETYDGSAWQHGPQGRGYVYVHRNTTGTSGKLASNFSAETTIFTKVVALKANRLYEVNTVAYLLSGGSGQPTDWAIRIKDGGTTIHEGPAYRINIVGANGRIRMPGECLVQKGTDTSVTFTVAARRISGVENADVVVDPAYPFKFDVADLGPNADTTDYDVDLL
jgi:hypothetical protein